jgi:hypothetical protein
MNAQLAKPIQRDWFIRPQSLKVPWVPAMMRHELSAQLRDNAAAAASDVSRFWM